MVFDIFDPRVSSTMNVFLIINHILSFIYNIPQIIKIYKTKSVKDYSTASLCMSFISTSIWLAYSIELGFILSIAADIHSALCLCFICYYKAIEINDNYKKKKNTIIELKDKADQPHIEVSEKSENEIYEIIDESSRLIN